MRIFFGWLRPVLLAAIALVAAACDQPVPDGAPDGTCADLSLGGEAAWERDARPIFDTYCIVCHSSDVPVGEGQGFRRGAVPGIDFDTYEASVEFPTTVWQQLASRTMPPMGRTPSTEELETLLQFLSCAMAIEEAGDDDDSAR